jgi:hypothetical protein
MTAILYSSLTNDELLRRLRTDFNGLTVLEQELVMRLERVLRAIDGVDPQRAVDISRQSSLSLA